MPYQITWEPQGVYKRYSGRVSGGEFLSAVEAVNATEHFGALRYVINDFLACEALELTPRTIDNAVAAAVGAQLSNDRFIAAFVASQPDMVASLEAVCRSAAPAVTVGLFASVAAARVWIAAH